jgi:hypothetical protein
VYQLVTPNHKVRFASSFAAILLIQSFQASFETQHDILFYAAWCTSHGTHKQFPAFQNFQEIFADLVCGVSSYCSFSNTIIYLYRGSCWVPPRHRGTGSSRFQAMNHPCFHVARRNFSMTHHSPQALGSARITARLTMWPRDSKSLATLSSLPAAPTRSKHRLV